MFDRIGRMFRSILIDPIEYLGVIVKTIGDFFEVVAVKLEKSKKMFVEADGFVVISVKQPFAMQTGLVDQTRQMNVATKFLVGTARPQRKNCTSHRFSTTISEADNLPKILPEVLMTIVPAQSRFPRNRPSMRARRQRTLLLLRSPLVVTCTSPLVRMERLKLVVIL